MITTHHAQANARLIEIEVRTVSLFYRLGVMIDAPRLEIIRNAGEEELKGWLLQPQYEVDEHAQYHGLTVVEQVEAIKRLRELRRSRRHINRVLGKE